MLTKDVRKTVIISVLSFGIDQARKDWEKDQKIHADKVIKAIVLGSLVTAASKVASNGLRHLAGLEVP